MQRPLLDQNSVHPSVQQKVGNFHKAVLDQVRAAVSEHDVVILGMGMNPFPGRARQLLQSAGIAHHYLSWGSYLSHWKQRLAIKLWSGWPTFPQIFVKGVLIGGHSDLQQLMNSGELANMLQAPRPSP
jgi:monothiol glutaredoxin